MEFKLIEPEEVKHLGRKGNFPSSLIIIVALISQLPNKKLLDCGKMDGSFAVKFFPFLAFCQKFSIRKRGKNVTFR